MAWGGELALLASTTMHHTRANGRLSPAKWEEQNCHLLSQKVSQGDAQIQQLQNLLLAAFHCCTLVLRILSRWLPKYHFLKKKCHLSYPETWQMASVHISSGSRTLQVPCFSKIICVFSLPVLKSGEIPDRRNLNIWKTYHPVWQRSLRCSTLLLQRQSTHSWRCT